MVLVLTRMNIDSDFLTGIRNDWTNDNLVGLQSVLKSAYSQAASLTSPLTNPLFETPNRPILLGFTRWFAVDSLLYRACQAGAFQGITARWLPLSNNHVIQALELRGAYTTVIPHHLQHPDDPPRPSVLRSTKRMENYRQFLFGFATTPDDDSTLINLTLVHGDQNADFAFLRMYDDPQDSRHHVQFSENIMNLPTLVEPAEVEEIAAPAIGLKPGLVKGREEASGQ